LPRDARDGARAASFLPQGPRLTAFDNQVRRAYLNARVGARAVSFLPQGPRLTAFANQVPVSRV
jgi:hypothetical protein